MYRSQEGYTRSPFSQANLSSSSLEGMERPVRSFKSFIRTVPPNPGPPCSDKPLPPTPSPLKASPTKELPPKEIPSPSSSTSTPVSAARNASIASWKAPAEWFNSTPDHASLSPARPPLPAGRQYSPLLPEPSPDISERLMELYAAQGALAPTQPTRLKPIYERNNATVGPPRSPPTSPLPIPPKSNARLAPIPIPPITGGRYRQKSLSPKFTTRNVLIASPSRSSNNDDALIQEHYLKDSPVPPRSIQRPILSSKGKAYASLGIVSPNDHSISDEYRKSPDQTRPDRRYMRGRKLRALNKGNPLSDDSWEDPDLDDKARQLSFSQDYHDLLVDQYQELSVGPEEVLRDAPRGLSPHAFDNSNGVEQLGHQAGEQDLVPGPLSWRKSPSNSPPRNASLDTGDMAISNTDTSSGKRHRLSGKLTAWVPRRLSAGLKSNEHTATGTDYHSRSNSKGSYYAASIRTLELHENEDSSKDLRFYHFFPPSKPLRFHKKASKSTGGEEHVPAQPTILPSMVFKPSIPQRHFSGGTTVMRTPPLRPRSEQASLTEASTGTGRPNSSTLPHSELNSDLASSPTSTRYSQFSQQSNPNEARNMTAQNDTRMSTASSHTLMSSGSSHPLASEIAQSTYSESPLSFNSTWSRFSSDPGSSWPKPGLLSKAMESRRQHNRDLRQKRLKDSIKVLGPTDPYIVKESVREGRTEGIQKTGRMPGYMVSGPA